MEEINHTEEQKTVNKTSLSKGARRNQIFRCIAIVGVIAAVVTAAFTGYYLHRERVEEKKQMEAIKAEKIEKQKKAKTEEKKEEADYEKKKDEPYADTIGVDLSQGGIPELLQWDERWGYAPYGTGIVATSGCGPTCMAMVAAGLNQDVTITPAKVAAYGTTYGYVDEENNTYWRFMDEAGSNWNLNSRGGMFSEEQISAELSQGHPVICSMGPGDFTQIGHFIVLTGYENGNVKVNDPFSIKNSDTMWSFAYIKDQIKAMWIFSKK